VWRTFNELFKKKLCRSRYMSAKPAGTACAQAQMQCKIARCHAILRKRKQLAACARALHVVWRVISMVSSMAHVSHEVCQAMSAVRGMFAHIARSFASRMRGSRHMHLPCAGRKKAPRGKAARRVCID
jgi:hypothetical protein